MTDDIMMDSYSGAPADDGQMSDADSAQFLAMDRSSTALQAKNNYSFAVESNPDKEATYNRLAKLAGLPVTTVRAMPDQVQAKVSTQSFDANQLAMEAPRTADLLTDLNKARMLHDDVPQIASVEKSIHGLPGWDGTSVSGWEPSIGQRVSESLRNLFGVAEKEQAREQNALAARSSGITLGQARSVVGGMSEMPEQFVGKLAHTASFDIVPDTAGDASTIGGQVGGGAGALLGFIKGAPIKVSEYLLGRVAPNVLEHVAGESFAKALARDVVHQSTNLGLASALGVAGDAIDSSSLAEAGNKVGSATEGGAATGAVFGAVGRVLPNNAIGRLLTGMADEGESWTKAAGSIASRIVANTAGTDLASGHAPFSELTHWGDLTDEQKVQAVMNYGMNTLFSLKGGGPVEGSWFQDAVKAQAATEDLPKFQLLSQVIQETKFRDRATPEFMQFMQDVGGDAGVENVHIGARDLMGALAQSGISSEQFAQSMPDVAKKMAEGLVTNVDLPIPIEDYAAHLSSPELDKTILPHLKMAPDGVSYAEAQEFYKGQAKGLQAAAAKILNAHAEDMDQQAEIKIVRDRIQKNLDDTGRWSPEVNKIYAEIATAGYVQDAAQRGIKPTESFAEFPIKVDSLIVGGGNGFRQPVEGKQVAATKLAEGATHIDVDGVQKPVLDSSGNPIHWSEEGVRNFWRWNDGKVQRTSMAGEAGQSAVDGGGPGVDAGNPHGRGYFVDDSGRPEVLYHGTRDSIEEFNLNHPNRKDTGWLGRGVYLTSDPRLAGTYANMKAGAGDPRTMPLYTAVKNPYVADLDFKKQMSRLTQEGVDKQTAKLKALGHDGVVLSWPDGTHEVVAFNPADVKSATGNRGTFDGSDANILHQGGNPVAKLTGNEIGDAVTGDNAVELAKSYFKDNLQGKTITRDGFGDVQISGKTWGKLKGFLHLDPVKARLIPAIPDVISNGDYIGRFPLDKERPDHIVAFHFFEAPVELDGTVHEVGVSVGEDQHGKLVYNLTRDPQALLEKRKAQILPQLESGESEPSVGGDTLKQTIAPDEDGINIDVNSRPGQPTRGSYDPVSHTITLLKNADLSTFIHELGHHFLEMKADIAGRDGAPDVTKADLDQLMQWFKVAGDTPKARLASWNSMSLDEKRPMHEQFAEGMEQYFFEGKAPSLELQGIFSRVKGWMTQIYNALTKSGVELTPEVRQVFDRMFASEDAIRRAEEARGYHQDFTERPEGVDEATWQDYVNTGKLATQDAVDTVQAEWIKGLKWFEGAKSRALREAQRKAASARQAIKDQVTREVMSQKVNVARRWLTTGEMDGPPERDEKGQLTNGNIPTTIKADGPYKLNSEEVLRMYAGSDLGSFGNTPAKWEALGRGKNGMLAKDGLPPDLVAENLGYSSADEMIRDLVDAPQAKDVIDSKTDQRMLEEHGEISDQDGLERAANEAINNESRARFMAIGLKILTKSPVPAPMLAAGAKDLADRTIAGQKIKDVSPLQYTVAESKANKSMLEAWKALADPEHSARMSLAGSERAVRRAEETRLINGGMDPAEAKAEAARMEIDPNIKAAIQAKADEVRKEAQKTVQDREGIPPEQYAVAQQRAALLNNRMARAATDALRDVQKGLDFVRRYSKKSVMDKIDVDVREQIHDLLSRFDMRKNPTDEPTRAQVNLEKWIDAQIKAGLSPNIPADILNPAVKMPYKEMTVEAFRGLIDTLKAIEHMGRERKHIMVDGKRVDLDQAVGELVAKMQEKPNKFSIDEILDKPEDRSNNPFKIALDHFNSWMRSFATMLKPQEFKRNQFDGHEILGPFGRMIFERVMAANYHKVDMLKGLSTDFEAAAKTLGRDWQDSLHDEVPNQRLLDPDKSKEAGTPIYLKMNRAKMLGIALHCGNESNFDKLTRGWGWDGAAVLTFLHDNMKKPDWDAVQTVWDMYEKHWPEVEAMQHRLGNTMPDKIPARPVQTPFGEYRGGYAAIKYDPRRSKRGEKDAAGQAIDPDGGLFGRDYYRSDTTTNGSLNARNDSYTDRVDLDYRMVAQTMRETIHDLAYREALIDVNKIIEHPEFRHQFRLSHGIESYSAIQHWLGSLANAAAIDRNISALNKVLSYTRTGIVINGIAFRISTVLKHGGSASIKSLGYFAGGGEKYFANRVARMGTDFANQVATAYAKFPEIRARMHQQDRDYRELSASLFEPESKMAKAHRFGHSFVAWSDMATAVPTAWAAYDRAIAEGIPINQGGTGKPMTEEQAVAYASKVVREAHGSNIESARSNVMNTNHEGVKMLTTLYGFMNNTYGQTTNMIDQLKTEGISNPEALGKGFAGLIVPALWAGYLVEGNPLDDAEGLAHWMAKAIGGEVAGMVPLVRDAFSMVQGYRGAGLVGVESWLGTMAKPFMDAYKIWEGYDNKTVVRDTADAVGVGLHIPGMGQGGAAAQYLVNVHAGKENPKTLGDWATGLMKGHQ
jgi:hypothetical protein